MRNFQNILIMQNNPKEQYMRNMQNIHNMPNIQEVSTNLQNYQNQFEKHRNLFSLD